MNTGQVTATAFDAITREVGKVSTRREFFRLLGGAAVAGTAVALTTGGDAQARAKHPGKARRQGPVAAQGKGKKVSICFQNQTLQVKKKGWMQKYPRATRGACPQTCPAGQQIAQLSVPSTGVGVQTPVLQQGQRYTVTVFGSAPGNATQSVDAEYRFLTANSADRTKVVDAISTVDYGLEIDGRKTPKEWGEYNPDHVYSRQILGQGRSVSLKMLYADYNDNSGEVTVTITCA